MTEEIWIFEHNERFNTGKAIIGYPNRPPSNLEAMRHYLRLMRTTKDTGAVFAVKTMRIDTVWPGMVVANLFPPEPMNRQQRRQSQQTKAKIVEITDLEYDRLAKRYTTPDIWFYPDHVKG